MLTVELENLVADVARRERDLVEPERVRLLRVRVTHAQQLA